MIPTTRHSYNINVMIFAYLIVWFSTLFFYFYFTHLKATALPLLLTVIPIYIKRHIPLKCNCENIKTGIALGTVVSSLTIVPIVLLIHIATQKAVLIYPPGLEFHIYQLIGVAFPEELFFRGFIQETLQNKLGKTIKPIIITSLLFSLCHLPSVIAGNSPVVLLSFFPSLIMGALYFWTGDILPSMIFHYFSNMFFMSIAGLV